MGKSSTGRAKEKWYGEQNKAIKNNGRGQEQHKILTKVYNIYNEKGYGLATKNGQRPWERERETKNSNWNA